MKNLKKVLALVLAVVMVLGLTACGGDDGDTSSSKDSSSNGGENSTPLVVGYDVFSQKFSPFYADTHYDQDVVTMTQLSLMTTDRMGGIVKNAIEGETINYNGTDYTYTGPADIDWSYDAATDITTYTAKLREDLKFSDGEPLTADDLIFTYYVYLDNAYSGSTTLSSYNIVGLKNYELNSTAAENVVVSDKEIADLLANPNEEMAQIMKDKVAAILTEEKDWCTENFEDNGANSAEEFFVTSYGDAVGYAYDDSKDYDTIVADVIAAYGTDYTTLAAGYAGDETYFDADMVSSAKKIIEEQKVAAAAGEEVPNITGIVKTGDYSVEVKVNGFEAPAVYQILGVQITPMHYYGDASMYDYDNNQFGFTRGDLSSVEAKQTEPLGAGPYIYKEYKNKIVYFNANPYYYKGEPKIDDVQFKEITPAEIASDIKSATVDAGEMTGSVTRFDEVKGYNSNDQINGDVVVTSKVDNLGYGYIGANAKTILVGTDPASDASKDLRKAFMTVLSVYRNTTVDTYYGEAATVINYPISNTSWAAPQVTDDGYSVAYSKDVEGNDIYNSDMSADEKYEAAIDAAVGFFKAAGYTYDENAGEFTAAPSGAKMSYEILIPASGSGDHPSFGVATDAKAALETIGIELKINDPADANSMWTALDAESQEFWCAAWNSTIDPDMYQIYHSSGIIGNNGSDSNHYHIDDAALDDFIVKARQSEDQSFRKTVYTECMNIIMDWGVELPVYQRQNCIIFSAERINVNSITPDITTFYGWMSEIEHMEMN